MRESATARVDAPPNIVFGRLVDIARLPEWNDAITEVVEQPAELVPGATWKVGMRALGRSWVSTSTLLELNEADGRLRHRSQTDDGNASYADWDWGVTPEGAGSRITVEAELVPLTFWRRYLLVHVRRPALRKEMRASLDALASSVQTRRPPNA